MNFKLDYSSEQRQSKALDHIASFHCTYNQSKCYECIYKNCNCEHNGDKNHCKADFENDHCLKNLYSIFCKKNFTFFSIMSLNLSLFMLLSFLRCILTFYHTLYYFLSSVLVKNAKIISRYKSSSGHFERSLERTISRLPLNGHEPSTNVLGIDRLPDDCIKREARSSNLEPPCSSYQMSKQSNLVYVQAMSTNHNQAALFGLPQQSCARVSDWPISIHNWVYIFPSVEFSIYVLTF